MCFLACAWNAFRERPPLLRELAQESEQNRRLLNAPRSSKRSLYRFRSKRAPHVEQRFSGVGFAGVGMVFYFLFKRRGMIGAHSSHAGGIPINQRLCDGFNWPPLAVATGDPVSAGPESAENAASVSVMKAWPL